MLCYFQEQSHISCESFQDTSTTAANEPLQSNLRKNGKNIVLVRIKNANKKVRC